MDNALVSVAVANLKPDAFYVAKHRAIFDAICDLHDSGDPVDILTISSKVTQAGGSADLGDLADLVENVATCANIGAHCKLLTGLAIRRKVIQMAGVVSGTAFSDDADLSTLLTDSEKMVDMIGDESLAAEIEIKRAVKIMNPLQLGRDFDQRRQYGPRNPGLQVSEFWPRTNAIYRPAKGLLHVVAGIPKHGKTEFVDALSVNMAQKHNWKTLFFSPENFPYDGHCEKLAEKYLGKILAEMSDAEYEKAKSWILDRFSWIQPSEDEASLAAVLRVVQATVRAKAIDHVVIDPWNEVEIDEGSRKEMEGKALGRALRKCRWLARRLDVLFTIVVHPRVLEKLKSGSGYQMPHLYDLYGGSMWPNKVDIGLVIYRHFGKKPYTSLVVRACRERLWGAPGSVEFEYQYPPGRYIELPPKEPKKKHTEEKDPESDTDSEW